MNNIAKVNERLKDLKCLSHSLPVIHSLIETGGNFELIVDFIQNANDLNDTKLSKCTISK
jgi:hypothetical protein